MPVRSLTDEEYEIIFSAAIQRVMNMDIDAWTPKCTSPKKAFVPKSKKYKITVGKPVESSKENKPPSTKFINGKVKPVQEKSDSTKPQKKDNQKVNVLEEKKNQAMKPQEEVAEENSDSDDQNVDNWVLVEIIDDQPQTTRVEAQIENETTPAVSGDELVSLPVVQSPPRKKAKKLDKIQKKKSLEPRQLPFDSKAKKTHMKAKLYSKEKRTKSDTLTVETVREKKTMGQKMNRRKEMLTREINLKGTWVQCCKTDCMKWRYLPTVSDPSSIPDYWTCIMNTNDNNNSCDKPEEDYDESEHIYAKYCEGSVVSAKMAGYPWWPAMIEVDPDTGSYFQLDEKNLMLPTHYHVVFLDDKVSRTWLKASQIRIFNKEADQRALLATSSKKKKSSSIEKELNSAQKNAMKALEYPIQERIKVFGFAVKFKGSWGTFIPNDEVVQEKPKIVKTEHKTQIKEELIDDSTMDDVLDNTEALLSNVEEMLDSLDSHLADSDEDSDFSIDELVCVEGRKKKSRNKTVTKRRKPSQIYSESSDDENEAGKDEPMEICAEDNDELSDVPIANKRSCDKVDEVENKTGGVHEGSACSFAFNKKLKLDSEIFTMELDDQEDKVELDIKDDEKVERENKNKAKDITDNTKKNDDFSKGEMKKNKQAKKKSLKTSGNICRDSSGKTNLKSDLNDINKDNLEKKEEERKNSSESCIEDFEKTPICDAQTEHEMDGHKSESSDSDSEITSELDNQKELEKADNESKSFSGVLEIKSKCDKQEKPENPATDTNDDTYSVENPKNQNPTADDFRPTKRIRKLHLITLRIVRMM